MIIAQMLSNKGERVFSAKMKTGCTVIIHSIREINKLDAVADNTADNTAEGRHTNNNAACHNNGPVHTKCTNYK